jgi:hypothetical protein
MKLTDVTHSVDAKLVLDTLSIGALLGTVVNVLPHIATVLTVVWMSMRIGETLYSWIKKKPPEIKD